MDGVTERESHLVTNPVPADHSLVTQVHQLEVGEKCSAPGVESCTRGLSCHRGGEATAGFPSLEMITAYASGMAEPLKAFKMG